MSKEEEFVDTDKIDEYNLSRDDILDLSFEAHQLITLSSKRVLTIKESARLEYIYKTISCYLLAIIE